VALRRANKFLAEEVKKGNVDWVGNLQFVVLLFSSTLGKSSFHFTKTGKAKVWLARSGTTTDIGKEIADSPVDSTKTFGNVVSGKILPEDKIIVLTPDLVELFVKQNLLRDLAFLRDEKQFQQLFKTKQKEFSQVIGVLFAVLIGTPEKEQEKISRKVPQIPFSLRVPYISKAKNLLPGLGGIGIKILPLKKPFAKLPIPKASIPSVPIVRFRKRNLVLLLFLSVLLLAGYLLFQEERGTTAQEAKTAFEVAGSLHIQAANALGTKEEEEANRLLQQAWNLVGEHATLDTPSQRALLTLQDEIKNELFSLNKIEEIKEPELLYEIDKDRTPQNLLFVGGVLYISSPFSAELSIFSIGDNSARTLNAPRNLKYGINFEDKITFFAEPNTFLVLAEEDSWQEFLLQPVSPEFAFDRIGAFRNNLYAVDANTGDIVRYVDPLSGSTLPISWLDTASERKGTDVAAISIDGNIWMMTENGGIQRYFTGLYREELDVVIFPAIETASRLITDIDSSYLYILDPIEKRLILLTKFGDVVRQYQSPAFDDLRDFALSSDGSEVYLLNGKKIYRIRDIPQL